MSNSNFDYRIYGDGNKTIIIETGIGNSYYDWIPLAEKLSESYRVILYHRCGYGLTKVINEDRTTENIAVELNLLVKKLELERFILLAHSFGGLCAQHYTLLYPEKVEKLILLDSATTRLYEFEELDTPFINKHCSIKTMIETNNKIARKTNEEKLEMNSKSLSRNMMFLSESNMVNYQRFLESSNFYRIVANEFFNWIKNAEEIKSLEYIHDIETIIISRDSVVSINNWIKNGVPSSEANKHEELWSEVQYGLRSLSSNSRQYIAKGCDHMIHLEKPNLILDILLLNVD